MGAKGECHLLFVPVRESAPDTLALRTGRLPSGERVGLAFTSAVLLLSALGPGQPWIRLHEDALHDMLGPTGVDQIRVDACLCAPPGVSESAEPGRPQEGTVPRPPATVPPRRRTPPYRCASLARARSAPCGRAKARRAP